VLNRVEGDVLVDHHVDAGRVGMVEDGPVLNADVDVVGRVVVLLGFVVLSNLELDARAVGDRIEDRSEFLFGPLVLPFNTKIEVLRESPRLREIQFGERGPTFEQEIVAVVAREDTPEEPRIDVILLGVSLPNAQFTSEDSKPILADHRDQNSVGSSVAGSTLIRRRYVLSVDPVSGCVGSSNEYPLVNDATSFSRAGRSIPSWSAR